MGKIAADNTDFFTVIPGKRVYRYDCARGAQVMICGFAAKI